MPCSYVIGADGALIVERWTGDVTQEELTAHKQLQGRDSSIKDGAAVLSDCTRARFAFSPEAVDALASMDNEPHGNAKVRRYAFLVGRDAYDRAQRFAAQVERYGKSVIVFSSLDVACTWLGADKLKVQGLLDGLESDVRDR